jgi:hypothetical protein
MSLRCISPEGVADW